MQVGITNLRGDTVKYRWWATVRVTPRVYFVERTAVQVETRCLRGSFAAVG